MATADHEALDFEPEDEDLMDEEAPADEAPAPKLKSAITGGAPSSIDADARRKTKGRGFRQNDSVRHEGRLSGRDFDSLGSEDKSGPARCEFFSLLLTIFF